MKKIYDHIYIIEYSNLIKINIKENTTRIYTEYGYHSYYPENSFYTKYILKGLNPEDYYSYYKFEIENLYSKSLVRKKKMERKI